MDKKPLEANIRTHPTVAIVDLIGEIDAFGEDALFSAFREAIKQEPKSIILNFRDVGYINSTGIALIVSLYTQAKNYNCSLLIYGLSPHYIEIFKITRLSEYIPVLPDEGSALKEASPVN